MRVVRAYASSLGLHVAVLGAAAWIASPAVRDVRFRLERGRASIVLQASIATPNAASSSRIDATIVASSVERPRPRIVPAEVLRPADVPTLRRRETTPVGDRLPPESPPVEPVAAEPIAVVRADFASAERLETSPAASMSRSRAVSALPLPPVDAPPTQASATADAAAGSDVEQLPTPHPSNPLPAYPAAAYRNRLEGVVVLLVHVGANGRPLTVAVDQSSGVVELDHEALRTVRDRWRFNPALRAGRPIDYRLRLPLRFRL